MLSVGAGSEVTWMEVLSPKRAPLPMPVCAGIFQADPREWDRIPIQRLVGHL